MASTYKTPGVYVEEISTFPASVAQVETAIPAFIGYTEKADDEGENLTLKPTRIGSLLEYQELFGGPQNADYQISIGINGEIMVPPLELDFLLFYHIDMFFKNGGGDCYIISIGDYSKTISSVDFTSGLNELKKEDEPTIILLTDAIKLEQADYYTLAQSALDQCADLQDRFAVLDVHGDPSDEAVSGFRNGVGNNLKYGAGYYPSLKTVLRRNYNEDELVIPSVDFPDTYAYKIEDAIKITYSGTDSTPKVNINAAGDSISITINASTNTLLIAGVGSDGEAAEAILNEWESFASDKHGFDLSISGSGDGLVKGITSATNLALEDITLATLKTSKTSLYNKIKKELDKDRIVLPPSGAIAGIYAAVDADRGVWKAPANVSLNGVIKPTLKIDDKDQESLNVDVNGGKSINAIRSFVGKGTLVWGARTLAGNDNEWRYVPVRRFFNMVEESVKKSTHWAVFEPNDANTWIKVKAMIENFLTTLWRDGALAGSTPEEAFFVNVGLGTTMTAQDILNGYMIVEIGMAAVRPAEFIVLRFSHKLQES